MLETFILYLFVDLKSEINKDAKFRATEQSRRLETFFILISQTILMLRVTEIQYSVILFISIFKCLGRYLYFG